MATQDEKIKWVEGSPFMVDGFRFTNPGCKHYLLTHFHSDHTIGLSRSFSAGTIYASQGTANLVTELMGVNSERVVALPMDRPVVVAGFELTLIDANHCPAAVMFVIRDPRPGGRTTLHTGDFRADKSVCTNPIVRSLKGKVDSLYLDTTYCGPRHTFPDQYEVLAQAARLVRMELQRDPNTLFLVGTYSIGKERVLEAVAKAAGSRCLVTSRKARMMRLSGAWDDSSYTTHDAATGGGSLDGAQFSCVRAVPLQDTNSPVTLLSVLAEAKAAGAPFTSVVGVRPTGWTHTNARKGGDKTAGGLNRGLQPSSRGGAGPTGAVAGPVAATAVAAPGGSRHENDSRKFRNNCGDGADNDGDARSRGSEDQDDEAAAWGAGGMVDEAEEQGATGVGCAPARPPQAGEGPWNGKKPWVEGNARVYSLPYSEHSSYTQLKDFVRTVRPKTIVPTVNASSAPSVEKMLRHFLEFMDLSRDRKRLESYFCKQATPAAGGSSCGVVSPVTRSPAAVAAGKWQKNAAVVLEPEERPQDNREALDAAPRRSPLLPMPLLDCQSARGGRRNVQRSRVAVVNPYAAVDQAAAPPAVALRAPLSLLPSSAAASSAGSCGATAAVFAAACPIDAAKDAAAATAAVELHLVDVEAQKAIMADIERRKRERGRRRQEDEAAPAPEDGGRETKARKSVKTAAAASTAPTRGGGGKADRKKPRKSCGELADDLRSDCGRDGGRLAERRVGATPRGVVGIVGGVLDAGETLVAGAEAGVGVEMGSGRRAFDVDNEGAASPAATTAPMDIRDFFSRPGW